MNYTNLNITNNEKTFKYIVERENSTMFDSNILKCVLHKKYGYFFLSKDNKNVLSEKNMWIDWDKIETTNVVEITDSYPTSYKTSTFNIYFPRYSVDLYEKNVYYALTINTWVNSVPVYLGSYLLDRKNATAPNDGVKRFLNEEYYEVIKINTINPFDLVYSDDWKDFRVNYCGEGVDEKGLQLNDSASNVSITLTAVKNVGGVWIKVDDYDSTQSVIQICDNNDLSVNLEFNHVDNIPTFVCDTTFNETYNGNLTEYLKETYQLEGDGVKIKYLFVIGDKNNPYKYYEQESEIMITHVEIPYNELGFDSWNEYMDGLYAQSYVIIQNNNEDILVLSSNKVYITQEIFKYLINDTIHNIDLNSIENYMNSYNVINVIENKVVTIEKPNNYKSNIIKPIFVKVQDADTIRLHRSVTENISINLDAYKNKVDSFMIKIGDTVYYEIGRFNSGIVFKIIGSSLPDNDGMYYILDQNNELVTSGKYVII